MLMKLLLKVPVRFKHLFHVRADYTTDIMATYPKTTSIIIISFTITNYNILSNLSHVKALANPKQ